MNQHAMNISVEDRVLAGDPLLRKLVEVGRCGKLVDLPDLPAGEPKTSGQIIKEVADRYHLSISNIRDKTKINEPDMLMAVHEIIRRLFCERGMDPYAIAQHLGRGSKYVYQVRKYLRECGLWAAYLRQRRANEPQKTIVKFSFDAEAYTNSAKLPPLTNNYSHNTVSNIIKQTCEKFGISKTELRSHRRSRLFVQARKICGWRLATETELSYPRIGEIMGGRDHTTIMYYKREVDKQLARQEAAE